MSSCFNTLPRRNRLFLMGSMIVIGASNLVRMPASLYRPWGAGWFVAGAYALAVAWGFWRAARQPQ